MAILEFQVPETCSHSVADGGEGWAVGKLFVSEDARYLIQCQGTNYVEVSDTVMNGDIYWKGYGWFAMNLTRGVHTIRVKVRGKASANIRCQMQPTSLSNPLLVYPVSTTNFLC
jgi:hypothetical protein